jgi:hypothetical protein
MISGIRKQESQMEKHNLIPGVNHSENFTTTDDNINESTNIEANNIKINQDDFYQNSQFDYNLDGERLW